MRLALIMLIWLSLPPGVWAEASEQPPTEKQTMDPAIDIREFLGPYTCGDPSGFWFELNLDAKKKTNMRVLGRGDWYEFYPSLEIHERELGRALRKMERAVHGKVAYRGIRPTSVDGYTFNDFVRHGDDVLLLNTLLPEGDFRIAVSQLKAHFFALCESELQFITDAKRLRAWARSRNMHWTPVGASLDLFIASREFDDDAFAEALETTALIYQPTIDYIVAERARARRAK